MKQKAVDIGLVPVLVEQLNGCEEVQKPAAFALGVLALDHGDEVVVDAGAVPPLVQLVSSPNDDVRATAIFALCMITKGSATHRDAVVAAGILQPLLKAMRESTNADVLALGADLLCDVWSVQPLPPLGKLAPFLPVLVSLIAAPQQDDRVLRGARAALASVGLLCHEGQGTNADRDALVECGAVGSLKPLLEMGEPVMEAVACITMVFVTRGSTAHVQAVIDADLVPLLVDLAAGEETDPTLKEIAAGAVGNVAQGSQHQVEYVVDAGAQKQANEGLPDNPYSTLVEQAGGVDKMTELQSHNDIRIASRAIVFLISHFPTRLDEQRLLALYQLHVVQAAEVETNVGPDDDICSSCDSDGEGEDEVA
ncbi:unnamed protein product [Vitrella brassicaformis CCMP3155]|uniref:Condensin complex subunit 1 C-terminal domain-containing protein n=1 Tax=Vitrella brassicaformis (strain CCMP3155) TaxID=1169540 RepID=A0A0G4GIT2_VITBC|nr:unnamed protein product [Vitrella brassicaformis CCMP3155]|eukprot:CEM29747.1 unnamed protein product [Vitrella brassicaformis CCMP3155]